MDRMDGLGVLLVSLSLQREILLAKFIMDNSCKPLASMDTMCSSHRDAPCLPVTQQHVKVERDGETTF